ncbi:hypothetical protein ACFLWS_03310 [Chloroflexota bacterium]
MSSKEKKELRNQLYERDETKCHYWGIEEYEFPVIWLQDRKCYGLELRGYRLEIDCKNHKKGYCLRNCVLACVLCNMAKSDKVDYEEFKRAGAVIREIWQRKSGVANRPLIEQ